jgi:hypothetical protein
MKHIFTFFFYEHHIFQFNMACLIAVQPGKLGVTFYLFSIFSVRRRRHRHRHCHRHRHHHRHRPMELSEPIPSPSPTHHVHIVYQKCQKCMEIASEASKQICKLKCSTSPSQCHGRRHMVPHYS